MRKIQKQADIRSGISKVDRHELAPAFIEAYERLLDEQLDVAAVLESCRNASTADPLRICFHCVETSAEACHRSLLARRIARHLGVEVLHLAGARPTVVGSAVPGAAEP